MPSFGTKATGAALGKKPSAPSTGGATVAVQAGDTWCSLAKALGTTCGALRGLPQNSGLRQSGALAVGQRVFVPGYLTKPGWETRAAANRITLRFLRQPTSTAQPEELSTLAIGMFPVEKCGKDRAMSFPTDPVYDFDPNIAADPDAFWVEVRHPGLTTVASPETLLLETTRAVTAAPAPTLRADLGEPSGSSTSPGTRRSGYLRLVNSQPNQAKRPNVALLALLGTSSVGLNVRVTYQLPGCRAESSGSGLRKCNVQQTIPVTPCALTPTDVAALIAKDDATLDAGSLTLKVLRQARPVAVNTGGGDKLSNCAIATVAAFTGGTTSTLATTNVRQRLGLAPLRGESEKLWTVASLDKLRQGGTTTAPADQSVTDAKALDDIPQARMYVLGPLQYYRMLEYLLHLAATESTGGKSFTVRAHGSPGEGMQPEAQLVSLMAKYPNGTRFAVFLYSDTPGQHVAQHWVYAEKFDGQVLFQDFQTSSQVMRTSTPADAYLGRFPLSPDKKSDPGKGFTSGAFVALAPAPCALDAEVKKDDIDREIKEAEAYAVTWLAKIRQAAQLASTWPLLDGDVRIDTIPAPAAVKAGYTTVLAQLGLTSASKFDLEPPFNDSSGAPNAKGFVSIVGNPHPKTVGRQTKMEVDNLNAATKVKMPGQRAAINVTRLPPVTPALPEKFSEEATDSQYTAFSRAYNVQAQNTSFGIQINADRGAMFTDLIHEAAHAYEKGQLPQHLREGCADVFASMVSTSIAESSSDTTFTFQFNPAYSHYVVATERLTDVIGLAAMAEAYFVSTDPVQALTAEIKKRVASSAPTPDVNTAIGDILAEDGGFPERFNRGLAALQALGITPAPRASGDPATDLFERRKATFAATLESEARKVGVQTTDPMDRALAWNAHYSNGVAEKRLRLLYRQVKEVRGLAFVETMQTIAQHEQAIAQFSGINTEAVRKNFGYTLGSESTP